MNIEEWNKIIAEFMGFVRYYPKMTETSELSKMYIYGKLDRVFHESMYVGNTIMNCSNGTYRDFSILSQIHLKDLQFNKSFDWLMPVVEKIESIKDSDNNNFKVLIGTNFCIISSRIYHLYTKNSYFSTRIHSETKIQAVYEAVINFIVWYNKYKENVTNENS